jgi:hypothetical protein
MEIPVTSLRQQRGNRKHFLPHPRPWRHPVSNPDAFSLRETNMQLEQLEPREAPAAVGHGPDITPAQFIQAVPAVIGYVHQTYTELASLSQAVLPVFEQFYALAAPHANGQQLLGLQLNLLSMQQDLQELSAMDQALSGLADNISNLTPQQLAAFNVFFQG